MDAEWPVERTIGRTFMDSLVVMPMLVMVQRSGKDATITTLLHPTDGQTDRQRTNKNYISFAQKIIKKRNQ